MKRMICAVLAFALVLGLVACANTEKDWQEQYDLGVRYLEDGDYEQAILAFSAAIKIDSSRPEAYVGRADAYVATGETDKALKDYKKAKKIAERSEENYEDLIEDLDEIIVDLEEIVDTPSDDNGAGENSNNGAVVGKRLSQIHIYNSTGYSQYEKFTYNEDGLIAGYVCESSHDSTQHTYKEVYTYTYGKNGQLSQIKIGDGISDEDVIVYQYTKDSMLSRISEFNGLGGQSFDLFCDISYTYDAQQRLLQEYMICYDHSDTFLEKSYSEEIVYSYNDAGLVSSKKYGENRYYSDSKWYYSNVIYSYDENGYIFEEEDGTTVKRYFSYEYFPFVLEHCWEESFESLSLELYLLSTGEPSLDFATDFTTGVQSSEVIPWLSWNGLQYYMDIRLDSEDSVSMEDGYLAKVQRGDYTYEFFYEDIYETSGLAQPTEFSEEEVRTLYENYFYAHYSDSDKVYLADVTHDGQDNMLVVEVQDTEFTYSIYAVVDGAVTEIFSSPSLGDSSVCCGWYLGYNPDSGYYLCGEYIYSRKESGFCIQYTVDTDGSLLIGNSTVPYNYYYDADDSYVYVDDLNALLSGCNAIYYTSSKGSGAPLLDTSPASVFSH